MKAFFEKIYAPLENKFLFVLSFLLGANSVFFIARKTDKFMFVENIKGENIYYLFFFIIFVLIIGTIIFFNKKILIKRLIAKTFLVLIPTEIAFLHGIGWERSEQFHWIINFSVGLFLIIGGIFLVSLRKFSWKKNNYEKKFENKRLAISVLVLVMTINFGFGFFNLEKANVVDEPLWTDEDGRIVKFWENISERDWYGTRVSDKPGVTVAAISGIGILFEDPRDNPKIEDLNMALRFPILIFSVIMLPVFYWLLKKLFNQNISLVATSLIGLSPIIIGMEKIINPDSLLWIFTTFSIISYFIFSKERDQKFLILSGIFLGLSILTKYVSNILFVFFILVIFLDYIYHKDKFKDMTLGKYLRESFFDYLILVFSTLSTLFLLYPAIWLKFDRLLLATIESQAFETTWHYFVFTISLLAIDNVLSNSKLALIIIDFFIKIRRWVAALVNLLFLAIVGSVFANVYYGMKFFDFESILSSPKSGFSIGGLNGLFFSNFYPLLFGISSIALIAILALIAKNLSKEKCFDSYCFAPMLFIIFIILYEVAAAVSQVASIIRYQIILYPIILITAAIALEKFYGYIQTKKKFSFPVYLGILIIILFIPLWKTKPFNISYASALLPEKYYIDLKDMGTGSYEAAEFLNSLPDAENLLVWSDKSGVCKSFVGECNSGDNYEKLMEMDFDYYVVSSGRQARVTRTIQQKLKYNPKYLVRFDLLYPFEDTELKLELGRRPNNFVKVISAEKIDISYKKNPNKPTL